MVFKQHLSVLQSLLDFVLTNLISRQKFSAFISARQQQWLDGVSWWRSPRPVSVEAGREPGFPRSLGCASFLRWSLGMGQVQQQPRGKGSGAGPEENNTKSTVFIWILACLTTLCFQMRWGLLTAFKEQLHSEVWLETRHCSSEGPWGWTRRRAAPVLIVT